MMTSGWPLKTKGNRGNSGRFLGSQFAKRLAKGLLIDRNAPKVQGRHKKKVIAPKGMGIIPPTTDAPQGLLFVPPPHPQRYPR